MLNLRAISIERVVEYSWVALGIYFVVGALLSKRAKEPEAACTRISRLLAGGLAAVLLFWDTPALATLHQRVFATPRPVQITGLLITLAGLLLTAAARFYLGRFWSASVVVKERHELIRAGPYARIRHPIYTGILTALAGTLLVNRELRFAMALTVVAAVFSYKARSEETLLARELGAEFEQYRRNAGFFLPRFGNSERVAIP
jgi:protein-S-isoprenylcysteine O-methyltransferase Ste14